MHRNSNIIAASLRYLSLSHKKDWLSDWNVHLFYRFLVIFTLFRLITCAQPIKVNFDCHKAELNFQCQIYDVKLSEDDKNAEIFFSSRPNQTAKSIHIVNSSFFFLPWKIFRENAEVKEFSANDCSIQEIYYDTFNDAVKLNYLSLSFNKIQILPATMFRKNTQLQTLKLDHNGILRLPTDIFHGLRMLRTLKLSHNKIVHLPLYQFYDQVNLETLELNNNLITVISARQFITNIKLTFIDLHSNRLTTIDNDAFDGAFNSLQKLDLEHNLCVSGNFKDELKNLTEQIECCLLKPDEATVCLRKKIDMEESVFGTTFNVVLTCVLVGNFAILAFFAIKKTREDYLEDEENIALRLHFSYVDDPLDD